MVIDSLLIEMDSYTNNANQTKDMVLQRLLTDKIITEDQFKTYSEKWQVIVVKPTWFKRWTSIFSKDEDNSRYIYKYVKFED